MAELDALYTHLMQCVLHNSVCIKVVPYFKPEVLHMPTIGVQTHIGKLSIRVTVTLYAVSIQSETYSTN